MLPLTDRDWSAAWFEGVARAFTQLRGGVSLNHVRGAADLALALGAPQEELERRIRLLKERTYRPDPARLEQLKQLVSSLRML
jgi:hypothetical protein